MAGVQDVVSIEWGSLLWVQIEMFRKVTLSAV